MVVNKNTELRKLRPGEFNNFALILSPSDNWKKLVSVVMKEGSENVPKFNGEAISIVEEASRYERKPAAAIFLEEWATMGRKRPTLGLLLDLLMKAELFRAADYLAEEILKIAPPERPVTGPAVPVDVEQALAEMLEQQKLNNKPDIQLLMSQKEMDLNQVDYPMDILESSNSDNNCAFNNNDVGIIEVRYEQPKSHQVFDQARYLENSSYEKKKDMSEKSEIYKFFDGSQKHSDFKDGQPSDSNLIKFSKTTDVEENANEYSQSDLIKFDSSKALESEKTSREVLENVITTFNTSRSKENEDENVIDDPSDSNPAFIQELSSTELPVILKEFEAPDHLEKKLETSDFPVCINDGTRFQSTESKVSKKNSSFESTSSMDSNVVDSSEKNDVAPPEFEIPKNECEIQELPITVLEFQRR